jgi:hypothetical protein
VTFYILASFSGEKHTERVAGCSSEHLPSMGEALAPSPASHQKLGCVSMCECMCVCYVWCVCVCVVAIKPIKDVFDIISIVG